MGIAKEACDDVWDAATNAVCQTMQEEKMCNCPDGDCLAAKVKPEHADYMRFNDLALASIEMREEMVKALRDAGTLLAELDLGRSIHNDRFPDRKIEGPLWAKVSTQAADIRALLTRIGEGT